MFEDDSDQDIRKQSLLSLRTSATGRTEARGGGSILSAIAATNENDPLTRHRLARSRREAAYGPPAGEPSSTEDFSAEPVAEPVADPAQSRWSWRNLLSPKVQPGKPDETVEQTDKRGWFSRKRANVSAAPVQPEPEPAPFEQPKETVEEQEVANWFARRNPGPATVPAEPDEIERMRPPREDPRPDEPGDGQRYEPEPHATDDAGWRPLVDPISVIGGVVGSTRLILATTIIGALIGVGVAITTPKKYEAFAELLIDPRDLKLTDRDLTQTGLPNDATLAIVENQVRMLTSGTVLNKVVEKLKLAEDTEFNGQRPGGIGSFFSNLRALLSFGKGGSGGDLRWALAVNNLAESLFVERGGKTFVVTIGATTEDPEKSALIANTLIEVFFQAYGDLQSDTAGRATDELLSRLDELRAGLDAAERAVEKYRAENDLVDTQGKLISDDELVKLNEQLSIARARTIELNARAQSTRSINVDAVLGGGLPEELASSVMSQLRAQYAAMRQEADQLSVRLGPRHPQYLAMQAQLSGAREQIANELRRIVAAVQTELKRAVQQEQDLAARLAQLKLRSGDVNVDLVTLRELEREAAAKRTIYEAYLLRAKETGEQRDINTANMSVISPAYPPIVTSGPSRAMISLAGMLLGFLAGVGIGIARGVLSSLRESSRARRRFGGNAESPPAGSLAAVQPAGTSEPAETIVAAIDSEPIDTLTHAADPQETDMNPLARLMERIRKPDSADLADAAAPAARNTAPQTARPPQSRKPAADNHVRANQEARAMYPYPPQPTAYPQAAYPYQAPPQPQFQQQPAAYPPHYAQLPQYPAHLAPQHPAYPYAPQPAFHAWQPQPVALDAYGRPQQFVPPYPGYPMQAPQAAAGYPPEFRPDYAAAPEARSAASPDMSQSREMSPIEEVRESLREFRDAIRDLTESRARRSF